MHRLRQQRRRYTPAAMMFLASVVLCFGESGVSPPSITITDTSCVCRTPSAKIFNCGPLRHRISRTVTPQRQRGAEVAEYQSTVHSIVTRFLDSTGYFRAIHDSSVAGLLTVLPGSRAVIGSETVVVPGDSFDFPPSAPLPRYFDAAFVRERAAQIGRSFTRNGYPFVNVTTDIVRNTVSDTITITFHVYPDEQYRFAVPELRGDFSTGSRLLLRDITVREGMLFDHRVIEQSVERLRSRKFITNAAALPPVITSSGSADSSEERITVPFTITDRSGMGLEGAVGLEVAGSDGVRLHGSLDFAFVNLFHAGEDAHLSYTGDRERQRLDVAYAQPHTLIVPFILNAGGGLEVVSESYGYLHGTVGIFVEPGIRRSVGFSFRGHSVSQQGDALQQDNTFTGVTLHFIRRGEPYRSGTWSGDLAIATGSGITRKERLYSRSHVDFAASGHIPLPLNFAAHVRLVSGHIFTGEQHLVKAEMYRVGGNRSLRGYSEDQFAFRTVLYGQAEGLYYFLPSTAAYLFFDGGIGFEHDVGTRREYRTMAGYGIGARFPAGIGTLSLEWARNIDDTRSAGRIHVRFQNPFSMASGGSIAPVRR